MLIRPFSTLARPGQLTLRLALAAASFVYSVPPGSMLAGALLSGSTMMPSAAAAATARPAAAGRTATGTAIGTSLTGEWLLNAAASQTLSLAGRGPSAPRIPARAGPEDGRVAPEDSVMPDPPARSDTEVGRPPPRRRPSASLVRPERLEAMRAVLGETRGLSILQTATYVDLRTELTSRSLEIGRASQVSLPTGELADQQVRWQGGRLVVERRVPRGVRIVETYRRLPDTDQLEVTVRRSGGPDDGLGKVALRRIFDRDADDGPTLPANSREVTR